MRTKAYSNLLTYLLPGIVTLSALIALVLTPIWAYQWYQQPFIGVLFEPNNVVGQITGNNWPAKEAGVQNYDQLIAVNQHPITNVAALEEILQTYSSNPLTLTFARQNEPSYDVQITPIQFRFTETISLFIAPYLVGLASLIIGLWVFRIGKNQGSARAFLTFAGAVCVSTATYFDLNTTQHFILGWALSLPIAAGATAYLALVFPQTIPSIQRRPIIRLIPWGIAGLLSIPIIVEILFPASPWSYIKTWIWSYIYMVGAVVFFLGMLIYRIARSSSPMVRQQSRVIIFGAALAFGPILFTFLLPIVFGFVPDFNESIAFPALVIFPLSVGYAIVRYRMLDVDRFLNRTLIYLLTATGAVGLFYLLITILTLLIPKGVTPDDPLLIALYLFILVVALNPLRNFMQQGIDRIFYRTQADYRRVLANLSQELGTSPEMGHTLQILDQELNAALAPEVFLIYLFDDDESIYRPIGAKLEHELAIPVESKIITELQNAGQAIWYPPGRSFPENWGIETAILETIECRAFVPLRYEGNMIGFLALGNRRSGEPYSSDDLEFLNTVAGQSSLALENVRLFANLQDTLNQTLEMKNLMDDIFQSMSSGVITTDIEQQITLFNQAAERILGASFESVIGRPIQEALALLGPQFNIITQSTIEDGASTLGEELSPTSQERGPLFLRLSCTPLRDALSATKGATIVIDDLTEQRHLEAERERIRQTFGRVVAPRVRDRLLEDPAALRLDGFRQPLTVLFADIHNFTPFSERTQPEDLFEILNSYLSLAAQAVLQEEGTLDKFMGDAVMAFWNAPDHQADHTLRAARAALAMDQAIKAHRTNLSEEYKLYFSIGINLGDAIVGNVGTSDLFNYTAIGDSVNYAQRLESVANPGQILLSVKAYQTIAEHVVVNELPPVKVKGKAEPAVVYELQGLQVPR
jgi:PAS domain S-box-containing protein